MIPLLEADFRVLCVSYDGFDETERTEFPTMIDETEKIENYIQKHCGGHIRAAYGCSLGGSFVGLLAARKRIRMDYGILGSSDLDQASKFAAKLQTNLLLPMIYPLIRNGQFKSRFLQKQMEKRTAQMGDYVKAFMEMFGGARPYVTKRSCKNQFYSDLITPLLDKIDVPGTEIHIFYALKMGEKYRVRYERHFAHPVTTSRIAARGAACLLSGAMGGACQKNHLLKSADKLRQDTPPPYDWKEVIKWRLS